MILVLKQTVETAKMCRLAEHLIGDVHAERQGHMADVHDSKPLVCPLLQLPQWSLELLLPQHPRPFPSLPEVQ